MAGNTERPLSPHLQVYRPQMTSVMSILHRITGFALAVGTLMVIWLLIAAAAGPEAFAAYTDFITAPLGQLLLFGWTLAFFYHLANGVRHLFWDAGKLFSLSGAYKAGYVVWAVTVVLTVLTWWQFCPLLGGE